jgi:hypothetical protein
MTSAFRGFLFQNYRRNLPLEVYALQNLVFEVLLRVEIRTGGYQFRLTPRMSAKLSQLALGLNKAKTLVFLTIGSCDVVLSIGVGVAHTCRDELILQFIGFFYILYLINQSSKRILRLHKDGIPEEVRAVAGEVVDWTVIVCGSDVLAV